MHIRKRLTGTSKYLQSMAFAVAGAHLLPTPASASPGESRPKTYANPIDLDYRFALADHSFAKGWSAREAADPTIVRDRDTYWLFASKVGGYWRSRDLLTWELVRPAAFPTEEYAPTVALVDGQWLLATSGGKALYRTSDPQIGIWEKIQDLPELFDPDIFQDDDGRVYLYAGSSPDKPITGIELDRAKNFSPKGKALALISGLDPLVRGWETFVPFGTDAELREAANKPWMEAPWMTKHKGTYYLQYAAPGTQLPTYADGVYTAKTPLGPFTYRAESPISSKVTGFVTSAGHSSVTTGPNGTDWRITTMLVGVHYGFERRLGMFPSGFIATGAGPDMMVTNTYLGDYPQLAPGVAKDPVRDNLAGWMLQTLRKPATASSTLSHDRSPDKALDEDIQTWWAAATGDPGEWLQVDMGKSVRVDAIQINFADEGSSVHGALHDSYRYKIEISDDGQVWRILLDRSDNERDAPHDYAQLDRPQFGRYARITNIHTPGNAIFSVSGLRIFGSGQGPLPKKVGTLSVKRETSRRIASLSWKKADHADFYVVRYGTNPKYLNQNYQVYAGTEVRLAGLNTNASYYFAVDAVNDSGIARSDTPARSR